MDKGIWSIRFFLVGVAILVSLLIWLVVSAKPEPVLPVATTMFKIEIECGSGISAHTDTRYTQKLPVCDANGICSSLGGPAFMDGVSLKAVPDQMIMANNNRCSVKAETDHVTWSSQQDKYPDSSNADQDQINKFLALTSK